MIQARNSSTAKFIASSEKKVKKPTKACFGELAEAFDRNDLNSRDLDAAVNARGSSHRERERAIEIFLSLSLSLSLSRITS
jgi:hypothetical protein